MARQSMAHKSDGLELD